MGEYFVPYEASETEFTEKRSRFIGHVRRVESEAEARAFIEEMRKKYYDARHNCWCYVLHEGNVLRYGDDGEPQGTAGQPMLNVFEREGVENVVCVVTRYFGGILLGAGGLTRAYAKSAKDALDAAGKSKMSLWALRAVDCPYPLLERLKLLIAAQDGIVTDTEFSAAVRVHFRLPEGKVSSFDAALTELSAGSMAAEELGEEFLPGLRE
ncbi:MAG: YigZ family protein, partial [Oscillospiraceae bacterium]|nr:YigZ family protein [Oscillospiraceae bacterium]